jgi:hypothetical protein
MIWHTLKERSPDPHSSVLACYKYRVKDKIDLARSFGVFSVQPDRSDYGDIYVFLESFINEEELDFVYSGDIVVWTELPDPFSFGKKKKRKEINPFYLLDI